MDKITSITNTDLSSNYSNNILDSDVSSSTSNSINSFWERVKKMDLLTWVIIILVLALLGFNIFIYLGIAIQDITNFFRPLIIKIYEILGLTTKNIVNVTLEDSREIVNETANVYDKSTTAIQNNIDNKSIPISSSTAKTSLSNENIPSINETRDIMQSNSLNNALNNATQENSSSQKMDYEADDSSSNIQRGSSNKSGWCFIGEDRGFRTCAQVGVNDSCISGDIFPSNEICINPKLRP
jgi:hypothetical protein